MKINFKFLAVFFLIIAFCSIVSADTSNSSLIAQLALPQGYALGGISGMNAYVGLQIQLNAIQNLQGLSSVSASLAEINFIVSRPRNQQSFCSAANITNGIATTPPISTGTICFNFVTNTSSLVSAYNIVYTPSSNNFVGLTGQIPYAQVNFVPPDNNWTAETSYIANNGPVGAPQPTTTSALFKSGSFGYLSGGSVGINALSASWYYNFYNAGNVIPTGTSYNARVNRTLNGNAYYSLVTISDSAGSFIANTGGYTDISVASYAPPIFIMINDSYTGTSWSKSFYYPNINLTAPITTSTINTPLTLQLTSSSGFFPTDINAVVIQTNKYNSPTTSGILYDNNLTTRHALNFVKIGSNWYQDSGNGFTIGVGTTFPTSLNTVFLNANTYHITAILSSSITGGFAAGNSLDFNITGSASQVYTYFTVNDQRTGSIISNSNIGLFDVPNQKWYNYTLAAGTLLMPLQTNYYYSYQGSANNYVSSAFIPLFLTGNQTIPINLLPSTLNIVTGNTTLSVTAEDSGTYAPIAGATVTVSNTNQTSGYAYSQSLVTSTSGLALFTVPNNQIYTVNVQATGYQAGSSIVSVGINGALSLIYLTPVSSMPTVTSIITVQTTVTLGIGNSTPGSSGINGDGKCSATMPSSFLGAIYNFLA